MSSPAARVLSPQQKRQIGELLRERERELHDDVQRELARSEGFREHAGEVPDAGDASLAGLLIDLDDAEVSRDIAELRDVGEALRRLPSADFGRCVRCGTEIPYERLRARPMTSRCTPCQALYEKHHAGRAPGPKL